MSCFHFGVFLPFDCKVVLLYVWMIYILDSVYSGIWKAKHYLKNLSNIFYRQTADFVEVILGVLEGLSYMWKYIKILAEILNFYAFFLPLTGILFQLFLRMKFLQTNMLWNLMVTSHSLCLLLIILHTRVNNYVADLQLRHIKKTKQGLPMHVYMWKDLKDTKIWLVFPQNFSINTCLSVKKYKERSL